MIEHNTNQINLNNRNKRKW